VLVVLAPGQGDAIQMLKAGLLEIADLFAVNKADTPGADRLQQALLSSICMGAPDNGTHEAPEVFLTSATDGTGIQAVLDHLEERVANNRGAWQSERDARLVMEVRDAILEEARRRLTKTLGRSRSLDDPILRVLTGELTVGELTQELFERGILNAN
jgi:LAO/AO transport system kinase